MARARNIKPSLLLNEVLGTADPLLTILFQGLWMLADRDGKLEDRPLKIKAQVFPYRELPDFNGYLTELERLGFILRYSVENQDYIQVINFKKHQSPHKTERHSEIPDPPRNCPKKSDSYALTVVAPLDNGSVTVKESLIPDSLIPDSSNTDSLIQNTLSAVADPVTRIFDYWVRVMGKAPQQTQLTPKRRKAVQARLREGYTADQIHAAIDNCRADPWSMGKNDRHTPFNDLELICRDGERLERFLNKPGNLKPDFSAIAREAQEL